MDKDKEINCINCNLRLRFQRQYGVGAPNTRQIISKWTNNPVAPTALLCRICWTAATADDPQPPVRNICVLCGQSLIKKRCHQLTQQNEQAKEVYFQTQKLAGSFKISKDSKLCHACWSRAYRRTSFAPKARALVNNEPTRPQFTIDDRCRVCLLEKDDMLCIFDVEDDIQQKIKFCTGLEVTNDANRPSKICTTCNSDLTAGFQFKTNYINSDERLSKFLDVKGKRQPTESMACTSEPKVKKIKKEFDITLDIEKFPVPFDADLTSNTEVEEMEKIKDEIENKTDVTSEEALLDWNEFEDNTYIHEDHDPIPGDGSGQNNMHIDSSHEHISSEVGRQSDNVNLDEHLSKYFPDENPKKELRNTHRDFSKKLQPNECKVCRKVFKNADILNKHYLLKHWKNIYKCDQCDEVFGGTKSRRYHILQHSGPVLKCKKCSYKTNDVEKMAKHISITKHTEDWRPTCRVCDEQFTTQRDRDEHFNEEHSVMAWHCDVCNKVVYDEKKEHVHEERPSKEVKQKVCEICEDKFDTRRELLAHMKRHNSAYWVCPVCGIYSTGAMKAHMDMHSTAQFECHDCGKVFHTKHLVRRHIKNHHLKTKYSKIYQCDICKRIVTNAYSLRHHIKRVHLKERTFKCLVCGAMKYSVALLEQHMFKHNGIKELKCELCPLAFARITYLKTHIQKEHGVTIPNCQKRKSYQQSSIEFIKEYLISIGRVKKDSVGLK